MCKGGHGRRQVGGVVIAAAAGDVLPRHEGIAGRSAKRTAAVGRLEQHSLFCKAINVGTLHLAVSVTTQREGSELVGHYDQHVVLLKLLH